MTGKPFTCSIVVKTIGVGLLVLFISSCGVVPKNYPRNKPFVYEYKINLEGNFTGQQKKELVTKLENQLDDSIHVRTVRKLVYRGINRPVLIKPPIYDSANADRSVIFMRSLLRSLGYFKDTITYQKKIDTVEKDQLRTTVAFDVKPGKEVRIDSLVYIIENPELQRLADSAMKNSLLKKRDPFAIAPISNELDRLVDLYRNNGYLRFGKEDLKVFWDTLELSLLDPTLNDFEQFEVLEKLKQRRDSPTVNLEIRLTPGYDDNKLKKFYIDSVTVYPDYNQDTIGYSRDTSIVRDLNGHNICVVQFRNTFKPKIFPSNIYLHQGDLYRQENYFKTINRFNLLGSWSLTSIDRTIKQDSGTADFTILLSPAKRFSLNTSLEGSRNQTTISGNLFGIALNVGLLDRNARKAAIQTNTNVRFGIEFGKNAGQPFIQTQQISFGHTIYFPRMIPDLKIIPAKWKERSRTVFSFNAANTERKDLYNLTTVNGSWGYEFQWNNKLFSIRIPNIEYSYLKQRQQLKDLIANNPSLKNIFTDGFIASIIPGFSVTGGKKGNINNFSTNLEESGLFTGIMHNRFLDTNLYRFIKLDAQFTRKIQYSKTAIALRLFAGVGYELNSTVNPLKKNSLPFFKQYFAGGPNSMRAWGIRKLGPGSVIKDFTGSTGIPDRYGDVQLEANFEYRFHLFNIAGIPINGAAFTDMGNVWLLKKNAGLPEEVFSLGRLGKDIAIGSGVGARIDFGLFVIRLDVAYKVKDPSPSPVNAALQNKWFCYKLSTGSQFQLGIGYPFIL